MADKKPPSLYDIIERVLAQVQGPVPIDELAKRVLAIYPSRAKNPLTSVRSTLRSGACRQDPGVPGPSDHRAAARCHAGRQIPYSSSPARKSTAGCSVSLRPSTASDARAWRTKICTCWMLPDTRWLAVW